MTPRTILIPIAIALTLASAADPARADIIQDAATLLTDTSADPGIHPDAIYPLASAAGGTLTYGIGADWALNSWTGWGAEYRRFALRIDGDNYNAHALALRAYATPLQIGRIRLRLEAGAGAGSDRDLTIDPVPILGARASLGIRISDVLTAVAWGGYLWTGSITLDHGGRLDAAWHPDIGAGLALKITPATMELIRRYRP